MNEEVKNYISKCIEYFELDAMLDEKEMTKDEVEKVYDSLDALDEELRELTPRIKEKIA